MTSQPSRRAVLALGAAIVVTPVVTTAANAAGDPVRPVTRLSAAFAAAARRHSVPRDLLVALSYTVTRIDDHAGRPSQAGGYGVMHLISNPSTDTLGTAAALTGHGLTRSGPMSRPTSTAPPHCCARWPTTPG